MKESVHFISAGEDKGLMARLKEALIDLIFEDAETDRPIGISQLTRATFRGSDEFIPYGHKPIVRTDARPLQDYRFNRLTAEPAYVCYD